MTDVIETWYCTYSRLVQGKEDQEIGKPKKNEEILFSILFWGPGIILLPVMRKNGSETIRAPNSQV